MSLASAVIDALIASGCTVEQLGAAVKAANAEADAAAALRREKAAAKKRRQRATTLDLSPLVPGTEGGNGGQTGTDGDPSSSEVPPAPLPTNSNHTPSPPKGGSSPTPFSKLCAVLDEDHARAIVDHRQRLRKPMTPRAAELLARRLAEFSDSNAAADRMIEKGWQSIEVGWGEQPLARGSPARQSPVEVFRNLASELNGQNGHDRGFDGDRDDASSVPLIQHHRR